MLLDFFLTMQCAKIIWKIFDHVGFVPVVKVKFCYKIESLCQNLSLLFKLLLSGTYQNGCSRFWYACK